MSAPAPTVPPSGIVFFASRPNSEGVPKAGDYRTRRFVGFASGSLAVPVRAEPGT